MRLWKVTFLDSFSSGEAFVEAPGIKEVLDKIKTIDNIVKIEMISNNPVLR